MAGQLARCRITEVLPSVWMRGCRRGSLDGTVRLPPAVWILFSRRCKMFCVCAWSRLRKGVDDERGQAVS